MENFTSYWGILVSVVTTASATILYFIKNWRDVDALKEHRQAQEKQLAVWMEKVDDYHMVATDREVKYQQALELKLQEHRTEMSRELAEVRREGVSAVLRLHERVELLDKLLTVSVERQNQLLDSTRRQEARNEQVEKILWSRTNARLSEE